MLRTIAICSILLLGAALPAAAQPAPTHRAAASRSTTTQPGAQPSAGSSLAANQFSTEQAAKSRCSGDTVVWANLGGSKAYHLSGDRYFGKTKHGAYMCQKEADASGFHKAGTRGGKTAAKTTSTKTSK
jgi:hypothetical protein